MAIYKGKHIALVADITREEPTETIEITENGEYDVAEYASANVDVPSSFPITVTFMNGDEEWAKIGVDGEGKIAEPTVPPFPTGYTNFEGWYDGSNKIEFPYAPTENKNINAAFTTSMAPSNLNQWIKNEPAGGAISNIAYSDDTTNIITAYGVGGFENVYIPVDVDPFSTYKFELEYKVTRGTYYTGSPGRSFIGISQQDLGSKSYGGRNSYSYCSATALAQNVAPTEEYEHLSCELQIEDISKLYFVIDFMLNDAQNQTIYCKDIRIYKV